MIEIEITTSSLPQLNLLAAMGVPEVWRHDGEQFLLFQLCEVRYEQQPEIQVLLGFPVEVAQLAIASRLEKGEIAILKEFRKSLG